jgi:hypothetical protein
MKALPPTGLAGLLDLTLRTNGSGSASPTRPAVDKSTCFESRFYTISEQSLLYCITWSPSDRVLTRTATTDSPARPGHPSERAGELGSPAKLSVAERSSSAETRRNGSSPGTVRGRPPRTARGRPTRSGGLPPIGKRERTGRPAGRPSPAVLSAVLSRWSL